MTRFSATEAKRLGLTSVSKKKTSIGRPIKTYTTKAQWQAQSAPGGILFILPENLPSLNVWKAWHWGKQDRFKKNLTHNLGILALTIGKPRFERARVEVRHFFRVQRRRDTDNMAPKFLLDALREAGVLADDNAEVLEVPEARIGVDREYWRTEIWIFELGVSHE